MYGFISGISDTGNINYCSRCGERIYETYGNGKGICKCGFRFFVVEADDSELPEREDEE